MLIRFFFHSDQQILLSSVENSYFLKSRCETVVLLSLHTTLLKMLEHMYTTDSDEKDYPKYGISGSRKHIAVRNVLGNLNKELSLHFIDQLSFKLLTPEIRVLVTESITRTYKDKTSFQSISQQVRELKWNTFLFFFYQSKFFKNKYNATS